MKKYFFKINNKKSRYSKGMTYVELIVVLSIYAIMTSIVIYNYGAFQDKVDTKNLASDIALKFVQAQNAALSGLLPPPSLVPLFVNPILSMWKPTYGVYLNASNTTNFIYFIDIDQNGLLADPGCLGAGECLEQDGLTQGDTISALNVFYSGDSNPHPLSDLTVTFTRPNSGAIIKSGGVSLTGVSYVQVTVLSPKSFAVNIEIYPSGRIQVN